MRKRAGGRNCDGRHRRSGNNFIAPNLHQKLLLNVREIYKTVDDRVRDSYLAKIQLDGMECLGALKFLMTGNSG